MNRRIVLLALAAVLSACGSAAPSPSVSATATTQPGRMAVAATPSLSPTPVPTFGAFCGGGLSEADCEPMREAALAAVAGSGHHLIHVWVGGGVLCPFVDNCLFNPLANFPAPQPPAGADALPIGTAEIAFSDTDEHAGLNLYRVDGKIVAQLIGYRVPDRAWCSGICPTATAQDGAIQLELVMPHLDWHVGEPIANGQAILMHAPMPLYGPPLPIAFGYREVGGTRTFGPAFDMTCQPTMAGDGDVLNVPLSKSGGYDASNPDQAWIAQFVNTDGIELPAGTWDVTAYALFYDTASCTGAGHDLQATLRVTVTP